MLESREDPATLERECGAWCRYLVDREPSASVVARYRDAHAQGIVGDPGLANAFDRALVRVGSSGTFLTRVCDVHARIFRPAGLLRRKLVLALALLESDRDSHGRVDQVSVGSRLGMAFALCLWLARFALVAVVGLLLCVPLRLIAALRGEPAGAK